MDSRVRAEVSSFFPRGGKKAVARLRARDVDNIQSGGKPARLRVTFGDLREVSNGWEGGGSDAAAVGGGRG